MVQPLLSQKLLWALHGDGQVKWYKHYIVLGHNKVVCNST